MFLSWTAATTALVVVALHGCGGGETASVGAGVGADGKEESTTEGGNDDAAPDSNATIDGATLVVTPGEFTVEGAPLRLLGDGDSVHLLQPLQGGHVLFLGAQVRNFPGDTAKLAVRVRRPIAGPGDTSGGFIIGEESRTVAMVPVAGSPDVWQPDLRSRSQVANVPLCPDYDASDVVDQPALVEFEVTALYTDPPVVGAARLLLTPTCDSNEPSARALCRCECERSYVLGKCSSAIRAGDGSIE